MMRDQKVGTTSHKQIDLSTITTYTDYPQSYIDLLK